MSEVKYVEFLNFLNLGGGDEDEKQLVGLRQASGRRQKALELILSRKLSNCAKKHFVRFYYKYIP